MERPFELAAIPAGRLLMGSTSGRPDEQPVHPVDLEAFRLGRTPVTHGQYAPFLDSGEAEAPPWWSDPAFCRPDQPVVGVTWDDACAFAAWLGRVHGGVWRLPTEAEWEWAARGGLAQAPTAWGDAVPAGEIPEGPLHGPWPVGRGTPNGFGLLDMGTIVHEWCADWYAPYGERTPEAKDPSRRSSRGGSWRHRVRWSPPSARSSLPPSSRYADYGFRLVCASP